MIFYEVTAEFSDPAAVDAWVAWILDEHIADVIATGASSGRLVRVDTETGPPTFAVQYDFVSRAALDAYLRDHAPRLRDEGRRRFSEAQVRYVRRSGEIHGPTRR